MNFLEMKSSFNNDQYIWYRGVSGSWHHWFKDVFQGHIHLHIEGSEDAGGYWGSIHIANNYDPSGEIFSTKPEEGLHVPFKTPENCALHLDAKWIEISNDEVKRNKIQKRGS